MSKNSLSNIEYRPEVALVTGIVLAILAFTAAMVLGYTITQALEAAVAALAAGAAMGVSRYTKASALGTQALAEATKPTKEVMSLEDAMVKIQKMSEALQNLKKSLDQPNSDASQALTAQAMFNDLKAVIDKYATKTG